MKSLLSPKLDFVFKKLFVEDTELLIDLINAVLNLPKKKRIKSIEVKNPTILPDELHKKFIILDVHAINEVEVHYDIEMQARKYSAYPKRALYYVSKIYSEQLKSGEKYRKLNPVMGIHFLDYKMFPKVDDYHFCFELKDLRYPKLKLTDDLSMHILELPKLKQDKYLKQWDNNLIEWLYFFNNAYKEEDKNMRANYKNPMIHKAFDVLEKLSADEMTRYQAEVREKALKDEASFLDEAREEGKKESQKKTAMRLLSMEILSIKQIAKATELNIDEIKELQTKI
ncbi:transposase [Candidatus Magnetomoraceae bacterium gMMP-1]